MKVTDITSAPKRRGRRSKAEIEAAVAAGNAASQVLGEKQQQAAPKKAATPKRMARMRTDAVPATKPAGSGRGRKGSQQTAGSGMSAAGQQGGTASGKTGARAADSAASPTGMRGGTKQVLIETVAMPPRPGRPQKAEEYPFALLSPSVKQGQEIIGPSFFIPDVDSPDKHVAAARKRHKGVLFWVRKVVGQVNGKGPEVPGLRVWRGSRGITA